MSAEPVDDGPDDAVAGEWAGAVQRGLRTVDELAQRSGFSVRTTRYYASLGLLPPPIRQGRLALYGDAHEARLTLIRTLQQHGFTLSAIERYLADLPDDASAEQIAVRQASLTPWAAQQVERLDRSALDRRAGRDLTVDDRANLVAMGAMRPADDAAADAAADTAGPVSPAPEQYDVYPTFDIGVQLLELGIPSTSAVEASQAIGRHMSALADDLTAILQQQVLAPYKATTDHTVAQSQRMRDTLSRLRQLTLQAVIGSFQQASSDIIARSVLRDGRPDRTTGPTGPTGAAGTGTDAERRAR